MLRPNDPNLKVYLHRAPIDMRRGRHGLSALAAQVIQQDVFSGALFLFIGRRYDTLKILYWDRNGFAVFHKVIEGKDRFHWPRLFEEDVITMTAEQLEWLMDGYDVWAQPHQQLKFAHVS